MECGLQYCSFYFYGSGKSAGGHKDKTQEELQIRMHKKIAQDPQTFNINRKMPTGCDRVKLEMCVYLYSFPG